MAKFFLNKRSTPLDEREDRQLKNVEFIKTQRNKFKEEQFISVCNNFKYLHTKYFLHNRKLVNSVLGQIKLKNLQHSVQFLKDHFADDKDFNIEVINLFKFLTRYNNGKTELIDHVTYCVDSAAEHYLVDTYLKQFDRVNKTYKTILNISDKTRKYLFKLFMRIIYEFLIFVLNQISFNDLKDCDYVELINGKINPVFVAGQNESSRLIDKYFLKKKSKVNKHFKRPAKSKSKSPTRRIRKPRENSSDDESDDSHNYESDDDDYMPEYLLTADDVKKNKKKALKNLQQLRDKNQPK